MTTTLREHTSCSSNWQLLTRDCTDSCITKDKNSRPSHSALLECAKNAAGLRQLLASSNGKQPIAIGGSKQQLMTIINSVLTDDYGREQLIYGHVAAVLATSSSHHVGRDQMTQVPPSLVWLVPLVIRGSDALNSRRWLGEFLKIHFRINLQWLADYRNFLN